MSSTDASVDEDWAEEHGYLQYKCPRCGRTFETDGEPECCLSRQRIDFLNETQNTSRS